MLDIVSTKKFDRQAKKLLTRGQLADLAVLLRNNPHAGIVLRGGRGIRKVRFALSSGKSGGARVIYLIVTKQNVILLLSIYAKSDKEDLSDAELNDLMKQCRNSGLV